MTEYNEGDLVEAVKGEMVARSRLTTSRFTCNTGETGLHLEGFGSIPFVNSDEVGRDGWVFTVIEKAKPKVELPSEPGTVITWRDGAYLPQIAVLDPSTPGMGWRHNKDVDGHWFTPEAMAHEINGVEFTRLEPRAVTAKAVLDEVGKFAWADGFTAQIEATAKKFGVTS